MGQSAVQECARIRAAGLHSGMGKLSFYFSMVVSNKRCCKTNMDLYMASPTPYAIITDENSYMEKSYILHNIKTVITHTF